MKNNKFILIPFVVLSLVLTGCSSAPAVTEKTASTTNGWFKPASFSIGSVDSKLNLSVSQPLGWDGSASDDGTLYTFQAADNSSGMLFLYYGKDSSEFKDYIACSDLIGSVFGSNENKIATVDVKNVTVDGKSMERVFYQDSGADGTVNGKPIDQCYKTSDYVLLMDVTLPPEEKIMSNTVDGVTVKVGAYEAEQLLNSITIK